MLENIETRSVELDKFVSDQMCQFLWYENSIQRNSVWDWTENEMVKKNIPNFIGVNIIHSEFSLSFIIFEILVILFWRFLGLSFS